MAPTDHGMQQFAESLLAEGGATFHGSVSIPVKDMVKIRALDGDDWLSKEEGTKPRDVKDKPREAGDGKAPKDSKDTKNGKPDPKVCAATSCLMPDARRGKSALSRMSGRGCRNRDGAGVVDPNQHLKPDCPVKEVPRVKKEVVEDLKGKETNGPGGEVGHSRSSVTPVKGATRALLDGGATHVLPPARSKAEYDKAIPIKVELAAGVTTLRQVAHTGTLITDFDTQIIVPLGKVVRLGYRVRWESDSFGVKIEVELEAGCPTVEMSLAQRLISELEAHEEEMTKQVSALRAGNPWDLAPNVWKWLNELREMWPEVPDELLARVIPTKRWSAESVPLNHRQRQRILSSSSVVLHPFSGPEQSWWKKHLDSNSRKVVCIEKMADSNQDLLSHQLTSFLAEVCEKGTVEVILGGPPCRTVSKLRFRRPGPPPCGHEMVRSALH